MGPRNQDAGHVTIRHARRGDVARVVELVAGGAVGGRPADGPTDLACYGEAFDEISTNPNQAIVVAEQHGRVVGTLQLVVIRHLHRRGGRCAEVEAVHVEADVRNQGVGAALMEWAIDEARRRGCYRVQLTSNVARGDAHRFYERLGFVASHVGFKLRLSSAEE